MPDLTLPFVMVVILAVIGAFKLNARQIVIIIILWVAISFLLWRDPTTGGGKPLPSESVMLLYFIGFLFGGGMGAENP